MKYDLPEGDPDPERYGMETGALWRSDADDGEGLMLIRNHEGDDFDVRIWWLSDGDVETETLTWGEREMLAFVNAEHNALLSTHNFPGNGEPGVFVGEFPSCPVCAAHMDPGVPEYHDEAIGFTCEEYHRTFGEHEGFMSQRDAIRKGYYITAERYLKERYGGDQ